MAVDDMVIHSIMDSNQMSEDRIRAVFEEFDVDGGGTIDADELQRALRQMDRDLTAGEIEGIISEIDANGDGVIDFDEFKVMVGKSWFIDAYKTKMARATSKALADMMTLVDERSDSVDDHGSGRHSVNEQDQWTTMTMAMSMDRSCDDEKERERAINTINSTNTITNNIMMQRDSESQRVIDELRDQLMASENKREALTAALDQMGRSVRNQSVSPRIKEEKEESDGDEETESLNRKLKEMEEERDGMRTAMEAERAKVVELENELRLSTAYSVSGGAGRDIAETVRKYRKYRGRDETKMKHYRRRLIRQSTDLWDELQREHDDIVLSMKSEEMERDDVIAVGVEVDVDVDPLEIGLLTAIFMKMTKFLFYTEMVGVTLSEFESEIEEMLFGDIGPRANTLTLCNSTLHRIWHEVYGSHLGEVCAHGVG